MTRPPQQKAKKALAASPLSQGAACPCGVAVLAEGHNCASCVAVLERNADPSNRSGAGSGTPEALSVLRELTATYLSNAATFGEFVTCVTPTRGSRIHKLWRRAHELAAGETPAGEEKP